jgi:hypothetical protein
LEKAADATSNLNACELGVLNNLSPYGDVGERFRFFCVPFSAPFHNAFAFRRAALNIGHPVAARLVMINAKLNLAHRRNLLTADVIGEFDDALASVACQRQVAYLKVEELVTNLPRVWSLAQRVGWIDSSEAVIPDEIEFMQAAFQFMPKHIEGPFGRPLTEDDAPS